MNKSITDHGAVGDGRTLNTAAFQAAVDACANAGGGTVTVPPGIFVTGRVELRSNLTLALDPGATVRGSANLQDYPPCGFHHNEFKETRCLFFALGQQNLRLTGGGVIDLVGRAFMRWGELNTGLPARDNLRLNDRQRGECCVAAGKRPNQSIFFHGCRNVRVEGIRIVDAPCWTMTFSNCETIAVDGLSIENHLQIPNSDGLHFSASRDLIVANCKIVCGDDCLAFTGITAWDIPCEGIVVTNCHLTSRSCAVRFGHLASKVRNAAVNDLVITDSNRGFAIQASDGGWVRNILVSNIRMDTRIIAGGWWGKGEPLLISATDTSSGIIEGISFNHVRSESDNSVVIAGQRDNIRNVTLSDWELGLRYGENRPLYGRYIDLKPAPTVPAAAAEETIPWLWAEGVAELRLGDVHYHRQRGEAHAFDTSPRYGTPPTTSTPASLPPEALPAKDPSVFKTFWHGVHRLSTGYGLRWFLGALVLAAATLWAASKWLRPSHRRTRPHRCWRS